MLKLGRITKVTVLFLVLVFGFNFDLFKFSAAIFEKGLLEFGKTYITSKPWLFLSWYLTSYFFLTKHA